jgi:hypothetical protein
LLIMLICNVKHLDSSRANPAVLPSTLLVTFRPLQVQNI